MIAVVLSLWAPLAGAQDCEGVDGSPDALLEHMLEADRAWRSRAEDPEAVERVVPDAVAAAELAVLCATEPLPSRRIAAFFRARALGAFVAREADSVRLDLRAACQIHPGYTLPEEVAGEGHPLRKIWEGACVVEPAPFAELAEGQEGTVTIDGEARLTAPADRPYVFQLVDADDKVLSTQLLEQGALPTYLEVEPPCPDRDVDGVCDTEDLCSGADHTGDSDGDGFCDDIDICEGDDRSGDSNENGVCDSVEKPRKQRVFAIGATTSAVGIVGMAVARTQYVSAQQKVEDGGFIERNERTSNLVFATSGVSLTAVGAGLAGYAVLSGAF